MQLLSLKQKIAVLKNELMLIHKKKKNGVFIKGNTYLPLFIHFVLFGVTINV